MIIRTIFSSLHATERAFIPPSSGIFYYVYACRIFLKKSVDGCSKKKRLEKGRKKFLLIYVWYYVLYTINTAWNKRDGFLKRNVWGFIILLNEDIYLHNSSHTNKCIPIPSPSTLEIFAFVSIFACLFNGILCAFDCCTY